MERSTGCSWRARSSDDLSKGERATLSAGYRERIDAIDSELAELAPPEDLDLDGVLATVRASHDRPGARVGSLRAVGAPEPPAAHLS